MEHEVLFKTIHGSRLYGLSHDGSDYDYYTVVDKVKTKKAKYSTQTIIDESDSVVVDFGTWVDQCVKGVPQALEAMFASDEFVEVDRIKEFRTGFRATTGVWDRYLRTIKSFAFSEKDTFKRKRHSLRLGWNLGDIGFHGRFNPTLPDWVVPLLSDIAANDADVVYTTALMLAWQPTVW